MFKKSSRVTISDSETQLQPSSQLTEHIGNRCNKLAQPRCFGGHNLDLRCIIQLQDIDADGGEASLNCF